MKGLALLGLQPKEQMLFMPHKLGNMATSRP